MERPSSFIDFRKLNTQVQILSSRQRDCFSEQSLFFCPQPWGGNRWNAQAVSSIFANSIRRFKSCHPDKEIVLANSLFFLSPALGWESMERPSSFIDFRKLNTQVQILSSRQRDCFSEQSLFFVPSLGVGIDGTPKKFHRFSQTQYAGSNPVIPTKRLF
jgi:hypothetical protein